MYWIYRQEVPDHSICMNMYKMNVCSSFASASGMREAWPNRDLLLYLDPKTRKDLNITSIFCYPNREENINFYWGSRSFREEYVDKWLVCSFLMLLGDSAAYFGLQVQLVRTLPSAG